jgi:hypothetical protein
MTNVGSSRDFADWNECHHLLAAEPSFATLCQLHSTMDNADLALESRMEQLADSDLGRFKRLKMTTFGREVGADIPRWWIFCRETEVTALWNDTKIAFLSAQTLVRATERVLRTPTTSYEQIIAALVRFLSSNASAIDALASYCSGLLAKDPLAPAILFSYAVWGSTRRSDRSLQDYTPAQRANERGAYGELALGLRSRTGYTFYWEYLDLMDQISDPDGGAVSVPHDTLLFATQAQLRENLVEYFTQIRDSLRHIDTLCQEYLLQETLYADDRFARRLLAKIAAEPAVSETDLWDLKKTFEMWHASPSERPRLVVQFAEDLAALANNRGGIILVGINNSDHRVVGVDDIENRLKHLEEIRRTHVETEAAFVRMRSVTVAGRACIVIIVGQTAEPVAVKQLNGSYSYPLRVGPGIQRVSRDEISSSKQHLKGVSFAFVSELAAWVM